MKENSVPAFPVSENAANRIALAKAQQVPYEDMFNRACVGMSMRDYFAAQLIKGCCPSHHVTQQHIEMLAECAYRMSDAMLAEAERGET